LMRLRLVRVACGHTALSGRAAEETRASALRQE
jgi:hypothetical protein